MHYTERDDRQLWRGENLNGEEDPVNKAGAKDEGGNKKGICNPERVPINNCRQC